MNRASRPFIEIFPRRYRRVLRERSVLVEDNVTEIGRGRVKPRIFRRDPTRRMIDKLIGQQIIVTNKEILEAFRFFRRQRRFVMPTVLFGDTAYSSAVLAATVSQDRLRKIRRIPSHTRIRVIAQQTILHRLLGDHIFTGPTIRPPRREILRPNRFRTRNFLSGRHGLFSDPRHPFTADRSHKAPVRPYSISCWGAWFDVVLRRWRHQLPRTTFRQPSRILTRANRFIRTAFFAGESGRSRDERTTGKQGKRRRGRRDQPTSIHTAIPSSRSDPHETTRTNAGSRRPPRAPGRRRQKNKRPKARLLRASTLAGTRNQADRTGRLERRSGLDLAVSQPGQRERERERRVSDADRSHYARRLRTRTLKHVIPK